MKGNVARAIAVSDSRLSAAVVLPFDMHYSELPHRNPLYTFYSTFLVELLKLGIRKQLHWTFVVFKVLRSLALFFDMGQFSDYNDVDPRQAKTYSPTSSYGYHFTNLSPYQSMMFPACRNLYQSRLTNGCVWSA